MSGVGFNQNRKDNFLYLNRDNDWLDFDWRGLELRNDGALQLYSLPVLEGELPKELDTLTDPDGPAGLAIDAEGTIYFSDPAGCRVLKLDACDSTIAPVPCIGGKGHEPVQLNMPRGLLIPSYRRSLFVADSLSHRVQIFDIDSDRLVDIWGKQVPPGSVAVPRFETPWTMAGDTLGNVYVVDYGNRSVQKFNRSGELVPAFWETLSQTQLLDRPGDIAVYSRHEAIQIYIIDETSHSIYLFNQNGNAVLDHQGCPISIGATQLRKPMGIAVSEDAVYAGDNALHRVLKFRARGDHQFIGEAVGYRGPVTALLLDGHGILLVHPGGRLAPIRLAVDKGYRREGVLWSRPFKVAEFNVKWHRVQARTEQLARGAHIRLFVHTSNDETDSPTVQPDSDTPFADPKWTPPVGTPDLLSGVDDLFIEGEPSRFLWIGAHFVSDGRSTPIMTQMRVEFDHASYLDYLPAIYRRDTESDFLLRFLSLFETFFGDLEDRIGKLATVFDPWAVPTKFLPWLAGWLELELDETWDEQRQRRAVASAFRMYDRRGTAEGLQESLRVFAGVNAIIEEPILNAAWWSLPAEIAACGCNKKTAPQDASSQATADSILGVTTMLAAAQPQGAVVGTTATLDYSHLITNEEFGAPLFEDVAHQFSVQLYQSQLQCPETLSRVRAVLDREKPAHTIYHLCIVEPRLRVGFQARVGIDAVVSGPPMQTKLDNALAVGTETVLAGQPAGRIGEESRVGITTRVG